MKLLPLCLTLSLLGLTVACSDEASPADPVAPVAEVSESEEQKRAEDAGVDDESAEPPANWEIVTTSGVPTELGVYASTARSNSGTTGPLTLAYRNVSGTYSCSLPSGVSRGQWATCTPSLTGSTTSATADDFFVSFSTSNNTDGLLVGNVKAVVGGVTYSTSSFFREDLSQSVALHGCTGSKCGAVWVDGDDVYGANCTAIRVPFTRVTYTREVECVD